MTDRALAQLAGMIGGACLGAVVAGPDGDTVTVAPWMLVVAAPFVVLLGWHFVLYLVDDARMARVIREQSERHQRECAELLALVAVSYEYKRKGPMHGR